MSKCLNCEKELLYYSDRGISEYRRRKFCSRKCGSVFNGKKWVGKPSRSLGSRRSFSQREKISTIVKTWHKTINKEELRQLIIKGVHEKSPNYNGGKSVNSDGYVRALVGRHNDHSKYELEHRLIMERLIGRKLKKPEVVHHINEVRDDNHEENLMLFPNVGAHASYHKKLRLHNRGKLVQQ